MGTFLCFVAVSECGSENWLFDCVICLCCLTCSSCSKIQVCAECIVAWMTPSNSSGQCSFFFNAVVFCGIAFVHYPRGEPVVAQGAVVYILAVASAWCAGWASVLYFLILFLDDCFHAIHATVADFDGIFVEEFLCIYLN